VDYLALFVYFQFKGMYRFLHAVSASDPV
jgi:hypothetical protein